MRMVSASKLNQTENRDKGYTVYNDHIRRTISRLISSEVVDNLREKTSQLIRTMLLKLIILMSLVWGLQQI